MPSQSHEEYIEEEFFKLNRKRQLDIVNKFLKTEIKDTTNILELPKKELPYSNFLFLNLIHLTKAFEKLRES